MTAHKHAAQMALFAQDAKETEYPSTRWEFRASDSSGLVKTAWIDCGKRIPEWRLEHEYRRKPSPVGTYHYIFNDGSMSRGSVSIDQLNELYGHKSKGFTGQLVKLTHVDGKPVGIEVIE